MNLTPDFYPKNIVNTVEAFIEKGYKVVEKCKQGNSWDSVFNPLDEFEFEFNQYTSVNSHLNAVMFSDEFNAEYEKTLPLISSFYADISTDKELYTAYKNLENQSLNAEQKHILKDTLEGFELSGVALSGDKLKRFKEIKSRLSILSNNFSKNSLQATNEWKKTVSKKDLKGYTEKELAKIKTTDGYELNLQMPIYMDVMTYADSDNLREEIYKAYISRASEVGITSDKFDNKSAMDEILSLRMEMANILDLDNYAELSIKSKMVKSVQMVIDFIEELIDKSKPQALLELKELEDFAGKSLNPWDLTYYAEKLKKSKFGFSKSDLTPYFPEKNVLKGLFTTIEKLYSIQINLASEDSYHPDVKVLDISSDNNIIGRIYLDLYARNDKRGGAWMADYQGLMGDNKPVAFVVCNLNAPTKDSPALFEFDEIVTIFHEFGHALHHILTKVDYPSVAGIAGVPWDGVELPSQYMEFFCYEKDVVMNMSCHYQTNEKLPDTLYEKLISAKNFHSAMQMLRQCEFALWDIKTHIKDADTYKVLDSVRKKTALMSTVKENRFLNTFGHIFGGGYAAGYFSYKWAEVLAADAYEYVKTHGGIGSSAADLFLTEILQIGGSLDFMDQYVKFRGKEPQFEALLKSSGISITR